VHDTVTFIVILGCVIPVVLVQ